MQIQHVSKGRRVRIVGFEPGFPRAHLLSMGLRKGAEFTLLGQAPLEIRPFFHCVGIV